MMGQQAGAQDRLFYSFSLEAHVPADHLLRGIDRFLDLSELRRHLASFYSHTGRPSIDPELMIRMLLVGYCFGIRSERRLCEEVHLNLAYRWSCGAGGGRHLNSEERIAYRSGGALDRGTRRSGVLRLLDELPGRCGRRNNRRCRGDHSTPDGRSGIRPRHARARRRQARPQARAPDRRYLLRARSHA